MSQAKTVISFAREFINGQGRTPERKRLIQAVYYQLTGQRLRLGCITCYIEAILKIVALMNKKPCAYRLKKGVLLHGFGDASKTVTNDNLTDELAEWHLKMNPGCVKFFDVIPELPESESQLEIVPPSPQEFPVTEIKAVVKTKKPKAKKLKK